MPQEKTPGVYIVEKSAFPNSVVEVPTAIPAFLGYTEKSGDGSRKLHGVPTWVSSMSDFISHFGGAAKRKFTRSIADDGTETFTPSGQNFFLFNALRVYFHNGGGPCWIVSVGQYDAKTHSAADFTDEIWAAIGAKQDPAIYAVPDAVALEKTDYVKICEQALQECQRLASRVTILDIYDGANPDFEAVIDGPDGFRKSISLGGAPSFGVAYYPWLNTSIDPVSEVDFTSLDSDSRTALAQEVTAELPEATEPMMALIAKIPEAPPPEALEPDNDAGTAPPKPANSDADVRNAHGALMRVSRAYSRAMDGLLEAMNLLPPSAPMAGVFARTDNLVGVFKAPANTELTSVLSPAVAISNSQQEALNVPLDGRAVNAIRSFPGRGVLVWGARTLDGNSQDYRYINVRRTLIMLEQSIRFAAQAYVFEPNVAHTWSSVRTMIENFLHTQWAAGALAGSSPSDAFAVSVGLGSTMTETDILDGYMRVAVHVAVTRPAEFIVLTFKLKMQTS